MNDLSDVYFLGRPFADVIRENIEAGHLPGARLVRSALIFDVSFNSEQEKQMGWEGEVEDGLRQATSDVDQAKPGTLGWLLAAMEWNMWALEAISDGSDWEFGDIYIPDNCDMEPRSEDDLDCPQIDIPDYDDNQPLLLRGSAPLQRKTLRVVTDVKWDPMTASMTVTSEDVTFAQ